MKTPEEIKKGLETCIGECTGNKPHCPYHECGNGCMDTMNRNSLAYINQLEQRLAQAERERDAAVEDLYPSCELCKYDNRKADEVPCVGCGHGLNWEWRGVCEENSKDLET